jgi:branched-chain amino acid transport system substrate-binding protein
MRYLERATCQRRRCVYVCKSIYGTNIEFWVLSYASLTDSGNLKPAIEAIVATKGLLERCFRDIHAMAVTNPSWLRSAMQLPNEERGRERMIRLNTVGLGLTLSLTLLAASAAWAQNAPGVTESEIKIGQTMPYSGPASAYATTGKGEAAYFQMVNDQGGVNGRKINLISLDDGYNPAKTVEQVRNLVEQQNVAFLFSTLGTGPNAAIEKYLNSKKIPQLFILTGADKFGDYRHFPFTMGWTPTYRIEARIFGKYILAHKPNAKIAMLYQNDDFGKDALSGLRQGLGSSADKLIVAIQSYEVSEPTIASQIISLHGSGADTLIVYSLPKFAAQAIRKVGDLGWKPLFFLTNVSNSVTAVMKPAGVENGIGIISGEYGKDPTDPAWKDDPALKHYFAFMNKFYPSGDAMNIQNAYSYSLAQTMVQVLKQCGNDLSRANIMRQAANLNLALPLLLPGIKITTTPTDYYPMKQLQLARFNGATWVLFGDVLGAS